MTQTTLTRELLERMIAGDLDAERRLFSTYRARLVLQTEKHKDFRSLKRFATADDVVQEVFWRALSARLLSRMNYPGRGALAALLSRILENTLIDMGRRARAKKRGEGLLPLSLDGGADGPLEPQLSVCERSPTEEVALREILSLCQAKLSPEEWQLWEVVELRGYGVSQLARERSCAESTLRSRLGQIRAKLQPLLKRSYPHEGEDG